MTFDLFCAVGAMSNVPTVGLHTMRLRNKDRYLEVLELGIEEDLRRRHLTDGERDLPTNGTFFDHDDATFGLGVSQFDDGEQG